MKPKYCVNIRYKPPSFVGEMKRWCNEHIGDGGRNSTNDNHWVAYWSGPQVEYGTEYKFWFYKHKDAMMFSLVWV